MKFSYTLIKKLGRGIPAKEKLIEALNLCAFEAAAGSGSAAAGAGDALEIAVPANRYSDAASHYGLAVIASAIFNKRAPALKLPNLKSKEKSQMFNAVVINKVLCPRYSGLYAEIKKIEPSPKWLQAALLTSGLRPINNVVDAMNYVMLEVGQPMHAFDADKISGGLIIRSAKNNELIKTIDGEDYKLNDQDLVIADNQGPLAIAGIKGGKKAEITRHTKRIIIEAATFDAVSIYKTSRRLNLFTDASARFSHGLSPALAERGIKRTAALLKELTGAKIGDWIDIYEKKLGKIVLKFDADKFNKLTGLVLNEKLGLNYLKNLGFGVKGRLVEAPPERLDIAVWEDLAEEIVNIFGYEKLPAAVPRVPLTPSEYENSIVLKDKIRNILIGLGFSEVYNYSFLNRRAALEAAVVWGGKPMALRNPISADFQYLRPSLTPALQKNLEDDLRFYDEVRIFEIGKIFPSENTERTALGMAVAEPDSFFELKGTVDSLLKGLGVADFAFIPDKNRLKIEINNSIIGYLWPSPRIKKTKSNLTAAESELAAAELNLDALLRLTVEEKEYRPLPKYPSVMRDLSVIVDSSERVAAIQNLIENGSHLLEDADLIDWYEDPKFGDDRKSLTFRLVFQAEDRTLTDEEVGREMEKIIGALRQKFSAEIR
jgi:phenylalanyl-tRNA synthetase beta chain